MQTDQLAPAAKPTVTRVFEKSGKKMVTLETGQN